MGVAQFDHVRLALLQYGRAEYHRRRLVERRSNVRFPEFTTEFAISNKF